jgi:hypothetical protein
MKFGSHLYGTQTPNSDLDYKAIYLPSARDIVLNKVKGTISKSRPKADCERNTKDDIDIEIFSLDRFLELLMEGQTVALDMLFGYAQNFNHLTPQGSHIMNEIFNNRDKLLTRNVNAFIGYARQQAARYGIKGSRMDALKNVLTLLSGLDEQKKLLNYISEIEYLVEQSKDLISLEKTPLIDIVHIKAPNNTLEPHLQVAGRKIPYHATVKYAKQIFGRILDGYGQRAHKAQLDGGRDYKAISHAIRVNSEALQLLTTGEITFPRPDKDLLLKVKLNQIPYEEMAEIIELGLADLHNAHEKSSLRDVPDQAWADDFICKIYSDIVKNG